MLRYLRRHLGAKLFLSYLFIILVGVVVLATTAEFVIPTAFQRHLAEMDKMISKMPGISQVGMNESLFNNFRAAFTEALVSAALSAIIMAVIASIMISRQVVAPVRAMMSASQRIAEGHYDERVPIAGDVSQREQDELGLLSLRFNQMAERLDQTEDIRRQLIADVTHELRTPLTTIRGYTEGLMDGILPANVETYSQINSEAERLQRLADDLQELSRVEAGAYTIHPVTTSVNSLIELTIERLRHQFQEKGVSISTLLSPRMPPIQIDEDRINQVLLNLVGNALQYTQTGGRIVIRTIIQSGEVQVAVIDTGIGIPPEHLPHIFTRFYRVDKSRSRSGGGTGIGLTIARHLVEAHGGRIWVESAGSNKGSTFTFTLPITK